MKTLWYENRFNPKKKGIIYDYGNYAEYITENMKRRKVVTKLSTAKRAMEDKGYEFIGEETEAEFKRRRNGFLYEKFENGERKIAAIQQPEYKGPFEGWYQSKEKSGKIVSVGPYETKEQVERVIREQGFMPVREIRGTSIGRGSNKSKRSPRLRGRSGILVSFHRTNRGLKFEGVKPFSQIISENSEYLYTDEDGNTIDETGRVVSEDDPNGETGELEFEHSDYYYTNRIYEYGDLSADEIEAIEKVRYISDELREIIN